MHRNDDQLILSATDLSNFLACPHLSLLDRRAAFGGPKPPVFDDPGLEVLRERGRQHEQAYLDNRKASGEISVVEIKPPDPTLPPAQKWSAYADATLDAMKNGVDLIYQGALFDGRWLGKPDFLEKVASKSALGDWSYEIVDTKLAREAKGGALLQLLLYADLLTGVQGAAPEHVHLGLGGPDAHTHTFRVADYEAYFRSVKQRFDDWLANAPQVLPTAVDPVTHCDICAWSTVCDKERRSVDHLSLVAGITRRQRIALVGAGVASLEAFADATLPLEQPVERVSAGSLDRTHRQARIQMEGRRAKAPVHELLRPIVRNLGLAMLPEPSPGDLFFDLEGDPYALTNGIEYLFGFVDCDGQYTGWWAFDAEAEKGAFEQFIDFVNERQRQFPDMHIYHFNHYEPTALKKLMGRYSSREDDMDRLLRGRVFVDLFRVVRNSLRASVESYSIKKLEPFYGYKREVDLKSASSALAHFEAWLQLGGGETGDELLLEIQGYNRDDCLSTLALRGWVERLRAELIQAGEDVPRPEPEEADPSKAVTERQQEVDALMARLLDGVPLEVEKRSAEEQARWLMAQLLEFYRREKKSMWWEYFRVLALSDEELIEDKATLGGLEHVEVVRPIARSQIHRYRFPPQEHGFRAGSKVIDPRTKNAVGEVQELDEIERTVDLKRGNNSKAPHPTSLIADEHISDEILQQSLMRTGTAVANYGLSDANPHRTAVDLLLRHPPRAGQGAGDPVKRADESTLQAAIRVSGVLEGSVLPIQGPPGAGKTFTGARMIVRSLRDKKRVGITASSHKVISNLLEEVCRAAAEEGVAFRGMQKAEDDQCSSAAQIVVEENAKTVVAALLDGEVDLVAGTAWLWSREELIRSVDLLFIDEAGQFSLANAVAVAPAAHNVVLLGDPQQLEQPQQGVHPPGADVSALDHLLGSAVTVPAERGLFLEQTWRLHPDITAFTSEIFYEDRLRSHDGLERQAVVGLVPLHGSGLRLVEVAHTGNQSESIEEVDAVASLVQSLLDHKSSWTDQKGKSSPLTLSDILIVAPYNVQVSAIADRLPEGARVGTVDKFQGQEAPIVIYSMTTSSAEDAPRGMAFLYSPNRLNVATSRAKCLAVVVASPRVFVPDCRTPEQMRLANAFCRFRELATGAMTLDEVLRGLDQDREDRI